MNCEYQLETMLIIIIHNIIYSLYFIFCIRIVHFYIILFFKKKIHKLYEFWIFGFGRKRIYRKYFIFLCKIQYMWIQMPFGCLKIQIDFMDIIFFFPCKFIIYVLNSPMREI